MTLTLLFLWLLQADPVLSPTLVAIVTALFTVAVGAIGVQFLRDKVNANSRIKGLIASLLAAYGIIAPFISNMPRAAGVTLAIIGLVVTLFSGRLQGSDG